MLHHTSDGLVYHRISKELSEQQKSFGVNFTEVRCRRREGEECAIASDSTWSTASEVTSGKIFIVRRRDEDKPAWYYILLNDDPEKIKEFKHKTQGENADKGTINVNEYGTVLRSGWGKDPSQEEKERMGEKYGLL